MYRFHNNKDLELPNDWSVDKRVQGYVWAVVLWQHQQNRQLQTDSFCSGISSLENPKLSSLSNIIWNYFVVSVKVLRFRHIFVAFSEYLNFKQQAWTTTLFILTMGASSLMKFPLLTRTFSCIHSFFNWFCEPLLDN